MTLSTSQNPEQFKIEKAYLHALLNSGLFSTKQLLKIKSAFGLFQNAWEANLEGLFEPEKINKFRDFKSSFSINKAWQELEQTGIESIYIEQNEYPANLKEIFDPPLMLYVRGGIPKNLLNIAVVGSRKISSYGQGVIYNIFNELQGLPICIVSGLAYGADACAHQNAIQNNLKTIAVLGSGVDDSHIYPMANQHLAHKIIAEGGAIISEFPPGTQARGFHFPLRNRIISGISEAVIVVEAASKSGALITADFALEQNRDLFAIPGSIFSNLSAGPNNLIKVGANILTSGEDLIMAFPELQRARKNKKNHEGSLSLEHRKVLEMLSNQALSLELLNAKISMPISKLAKIIFDLEIQGQIAQNDGIFYAQNLTTLNQHR